MTTEEKDLLRKDLCARLPYGVKVTWDDKYPITVTPYIYCAIASEANIDKLPKLLLRPMSSMTEEEENEWWKFANESYVVNEHTSSLDWLNAHHFDYRGLIEKGLAIAVTEENNPYKE